MHKQNNTATAQRYSLFSQETEQLLFRRLGFTSYGEVLDRDYATPPKTTTPHPCSNWLRSVRASMTSIFNY